MNHYNFQKKINGSPFLKEFLIPITQNYGQVTGRHNLMLQISSILENPLFGRVIGYCYNYCDKFCDWWI